MTRNAMTNEVGLQLREALYCCARQMGVLRRQLLAEQKQVLSRKSIRSRYDVEPARVDALIDQYLVELPCGGYALEHVLELDDFIKGWAEIPVRTQSGGSAATRASESPRPGQQAGDSTHATSRKHPAVSSIGGSGAPKTPPRGEDVDCWDAEASDPGLGGSSSADDDHLAADRGAVAGGSTERIAS